MMLRPFHSLAAKIRRRSTSPRVIISLDETGFRRRLVDRNGESETHVPGFETNATTFYRNEQKSETLVPLQLN